MYKRVSANSTTQRSVFMASLMSLLSGCDVLFDTAIDCLDDDGPTFVQRELAMPVLNQTYSQILTVRIDNEPFDDRFFYDFAVEGNLPAGITANQQVSGGRNVLFEGTATELGTFPFTVLVAVVDRGGDTTGLCFTSRSRNFELAVEPL